MSPAQNCTCSRGGDDLSVRASLHPLSCKTLWYTFDILSDEHFPSAFGAQRLFQTFQDNDHI